MPVNHIWQLAQMKTPRIGILGGTFDPVHKGHIDMCKIAMREFGLDRVWLLVAGDPPHKGDKIAHAEQRFRMAEIACEGEEHIEANRMEIDRKGTTYTVDTLEELHQNLPAGTEIYFIIGADTLYELHTWKRIQRVMHLASFITIPRAGYNRHELWAYYMTLGTHTKMRIMLSTASAQDVSSTNVRRRIAQELPVEDLLDAAVEAYVREKKLYRDATLRFEEVEEKLKAVLSPARYAHTRGVVEMAEALAEEYGLHREQTRWAALLHDCGKQEEKKPLSMLMQEYGLSPQEDFIYAPQLIHAPLGAILAKREYDMYDEGILHAISSHTCGAQEMSKLDKALFVADACEKNRSYPGVEALRRLAFEDLDEAAIAALDESIVHVVAKGGFLASQSVLTRNRLWIERRRREEKIQGEDHTEG